VLAVALEQHEPVHAAAVDQRREVVILGDLREVDVGPSHLCEKLFSGRRLTSIQAARRPLAVRTRARSRAARSRAKMITARVWFSGSARPQSDSPSSS